MRDKREPTGDNREPTDFVHLDDRDGVRYVIRPAAIDAVADGSGRKETVFHLRGGQSVRVRLTLDEVTLWLSACWSPDGEVVSPDRPD